MGLPNYDGFLGSHSQRRREGSRVRALQAVRRGKALGDSPREGARVRIGSL